MTDVIARAVHSLASMFQAIWDALARAWQHLKAILVRLPPIRMRRIARLRAEALAASRKAEDYDRAGMQLAATRARMRAVGLLASARDLERQ